MGERAYEVRVARAGKSGRTSHRLRRRRLLRCPGSTGPRTLRVATVGRRITVTVRVSGRRTWSVPGRIGLSVRAWRSGRRVVLFAASDRRDRDERQNDRERDTCTLHGSGQRITSPRRSGLRTRVPLASKAVVSSCYSGAQVFRDGGRARGDISVACPEAALAKAVRVGRALGSHQPTGFVEVRGGRGIRVGFFDDVQTAAPS